MHVHTYAHTNTISSALPLSAVAGRVPSKPPARLQPHRAGRRDARGVVWARSTPTQKSAHMHAHKPLGSCTHNLSGFAPICSRRTCSPQTSNTPTAFPDRGYPRGAFGRRSQRRKQKRETHTRTHAQIPWLVRKQPLYLPLFAVAGRVPSKPATRLQSPWAGDTRRGVWASRSSPGNATGT